MTETERRRYNWFHGWIPRTMKAALQKTGGDREAAEALLARERTERRARRRARGPAEFVSPNPAHQAAAAERDRWRSLDDEHLAAALGTAEDDATVDAIVAELDRRDAAAAKAERARERRAARRDAAERERGRLFDEATEAGEDPEAAYRRIWGVTEERQRKEEATRSLREGGYTGGTFSRMVKHAHADAVAERYAHAEEVCRGHLLSPAGQRAGVDPASLWSGPAAAAKKYASEELRDYWRDYGGRLTLADFSAEVLGGHAKFRTTGDDW